jgi:8-oxo-dGTP pyrophosphatase MutT (NUDIX family)
VPSSLRFRRAAFRLTYRLLRVWWFIRRPHIEGVKCLLTRGGEVLLVRHTYGPDVWDLPGGGVKRREAPLHAAQREMSEELGLEDAEWRDAGTIHGRQSFRHDTVHCFQAELSSRSVDPNPAELAETQWFARTALPQRVGIYAAPVLEGRGTAR